MKTLCIITRVHPARPNMLDVCVESVKNQQCGDYQHLLLRDDDTTGGYGVEAANRALHDVKGIDGRYIMVLDDDDMLVDGGVVQDIVDAVASRPAIVVFKGIAGDHGILPSPDTWKSPPVRGKIGSFCYAVRRSYWEAYCSYWVSSYGYPAMGDFTFINACYKDAEDVVWLDRLVAVTQKGASYGRGE